MTPAQKKRFEKLAKDMASLLKELESDHPNIGLFIDDGVPYLVDANGGESPRDRIVAMGAYWHRSGGGGF